MVSTGSGVWNRLSFPPSIIWHKAVDKISGCPLSTETARHGAPHQNGARNVIFFAFFVKSPKTSPKTVQAWCPQAVAFGTAEDRFFKKNKKSLFFAQKSLLLVRERFSHEAFEHDKILYIAVKNGIRFQSAQRAQAWCPQACASYLGTFRTHQKLLKRTFS